MNRKKTCSALLLILFLFWLFGSAYSHTVTASQENNLIQKDQLLIAVLDTGYSGSDSRIADNSYNALDGSADITDGNGHGTDITSIILNNTLEQATILPIKIADYVGVSNEDAACKGIQYAMDMDADMIHIALNMSNLSSDSKLYRLLNEAIASGIDVVTSAGNNGKSTETFFPANIEDAIVVSAANPNGDFWKYSNFGDTIDFASNGYYNGKTGTSYATARIAAMLANEYLSGGNLETLKEKAVDAGIKGKDPLYGYGLLMCDSDISDKGNTDTYVGRSANDLGPKLLDIDWKNTDAAKLNEYFIETHRAYVGMYLSRLSEQELLELKKKVPVLNTNVLVQDFKLVPLTSSYKESASFEESFVANALSTYQSYEEELSISAEYLMLKNSGYFAISSHDRNDIYYFQVNGFSYRVANQDSEWFQMFNPAELTVTRTIVKQTTGFGAVYVSGLSTYVCGVSSFAEEYTHTYTGQVIAQNNLFSIDAEADDGALGYGLAVQISGYSNYKQGYHTTETDIIQIPYNFAHTYSQYSYASYPEPLQYIFSYYIPETNDVGYSTVPQRVEVQPKNFKTLMPVTMKIWYDGVYKDGLDYRNVNESLSLWDKLNTYLKSWKEKTVHGVNIYSDQTSLTNTGLTINFNIGCSMGIQWNNGETSTVATLSDIPEYNFPLVINTYRIKYHGNGATSGSMADTSMTYNVTKNLTANAFQRTGYIFQGWSTSSTGTAIYSNSQSVANLTDQHNATVNLYAVWKPISYTIRYHGNGATSGSMGDMAMVYDTAKNLDPNKYVKTGYIFQGWATSSTGGVVYTNGQSVKNLTTTNGGIIHLYAVWSPLTYTIRYHGNGSTSGSMPDSIMTYDKAANLSINIYKKTGYLFQGWSTSSTGSVVYSDGQSVINLTTTPGDIIHLYAVWKPITYTIRFHGNGSTSGSMADITATYNKNVTLTLNAYFKTGYTFHSWNTQSNGSGTSYSDGQTVKNLTATNGAIVYLYAQWTPNPYTIVFHANGGEGSMASIRATYDTPITLPRSTFTKSTVYGPSVFKGWHTNSSTFTLLYADGATVLNLTAAYNGVVTLYAIWDDCPWIIAEDLYYTLKEAQEGYITYDELMLHALAEDREDGSPIPPGTNAQKGTSFVIVDYQASDFSQFQNSGSVTETYKVTDSSGSSYSKLITVHITDTDAYIPPPVGTTRFINETYYKKSFSQGGLNTDSVWLNNQLYKTALEKAFANSRNNKPEASFFFSYEDILEMKDYVNTNGHGTTQNPDALRLFYNLFLVPNKKT